MAMASATETPQTGYPLTDPTGRMFTYIVDPSCPPPSHSHFQNNNNKTPICFIITIIFSSIVALICVPLVLFFIFGPHSPTVSVEQVSTPDPMFYTSPTTLSSLLTITLKLSNPARHVGVFFEPENSIVATYSGIHLCRGGIPPFFQAPEAKMSVKSALAGVGEQLPDDVYRRLEDDHKKKRVPLGLNVMGMVRFKMGSITSRAFLKVTCEVVVDSMLTSSPKIVSSRCASASAFWVPVIRP